MDEQWFWYSGSNDEWYNSGPFKTRDEAVAELDGYGGFVIEARKQRLTFSAKALIEAQYYEADDLFSYDNGDEPDGPGDEAEAELQALLDAWTDKWRTRFTQPSLFAASRNAERIEPDAPPTTTLADSDGEQ